MASETLPEEEASERQQQSVRRFVHELHETTPRIIVTPAIIGLNLLIFALMVITGAGLFQPGTQALIKWGASNGYQLVFTGQWWRLLTSTFVHIGVVHLALNMWVMYSVAPVVERLFGNIGFALLYLFSGILASIASVWWAGADPHVSAGASGAIFGIIGGFAGWLLRQHGTMPAVLRKRLLNNLIWFIILNVGIGLQLDFVDNAAHIGGLAAGFVCGLGLSSPVGRASLRRRPQHNLLAAMIGATAIAALCMALPYLLPKSVRQQARLIQGMHSRTPAELEKLVWQELQADPSSEALIQQYGFLLQQRQAWDEGIRNMSELLKKNPESIVALEWRAFFHDKLNHLKEALNDYTALLEAEPENTQYLNQRGFILLMLGRHDEAEADWRKAAEQEVTPHDKAGQWENIGLIYLARGEWQRTLAHARTVANVDRELGWNMLFMALAAEQLGQEDLAAQSWELYSRWSYTQPPDTYEPLRRYLPAELRARVKEPPPGARPMGEPAPASAPASAPGERPASDDEPTTGSVQPLE